MPDETSSRLTFTQARPVDLLYVESGETYDSKTPYAVRRATDVVPDPSFQTAPLSVTLLAFHAGDLPGEDDVADAMKAGLRYAFSRKRRERADEARRRNEVYLKVGVDFYTWTRQTDGTEGLDGPWGADYGVHFAVEDFHRAGRFTDRRVFENVLVRNDLTLRVQMQEVDGEEGDLGAYSALFKDTGLDGVLRLGRLDPVIGLASKLFTNILRLNKSDVVWDETLTLSTRPAPGQSMLREGIYVLVEAPQQRPETPVGPPSLFFLDGLLYEGEQGKGRAVSVSYLVFSITRTPVPPPPPKSGRTAKAREADEPPSPPEEGMRMMQQFPMRRSV